MKKVFIIGGGVDASNYKDFEDYLLKQEFNPYEEKVLNWKDTLQNDLGEGFEVIKIPMPNKGFAEYKYWCIMFQKVLLYFSEENILIGHSLGAIFLLKYLNENYLENISGVHLISPALYDTPEEKLGSFSLDKNLENFKKYEDITNFYFSKNDYCIPFEQCYDFQKILKKAKYNIFDNYGHFRGEEVKNFLELVNNIKK